MKKHDTSESLRMALETLRTHKFRSFLTVLGVVIGTVTVMVIAAFIAGLDKKFQQDIEVFGTNTIFIYKFDPGIRVGRLSPEERMRKPISYEDSVAIREQCPSVTYVAPFLSPDDVAKVRYQNESSTSPRCRARCTEYERMASVNVSEGRFFTETENQHRSEVCRLGADIADKFFPHVQALGKRFWSTKNRSWCWSVSRSRKLLRGRERRRQSESRCVRAVRSDAQDVSGRNRPLRNGSSAGGKDVRRR